MTIDKCYTDALDEAVRCFNRGERNRTIRLFRGVMEISLTHRSVNILLLKKAPHFYRQMRPIAARYAIAGSLRSEPGVAAYTTLLTFVPKR